MGGRGDAGGRGNVIQCLEAIKTGRGESCDLPRSRAKQVCFLPSVFRGWPPSGAAAIFISRQCIEDITITTEPYSGRQTV